MKLKKTLTRLFGFAALGTAIAAGALVRSGTTNPGSTMADGTVYAGLSPDIAQPIYTTRADAPGRYTWEAAIRYCDDLKAGGQIPLRKSREGVKDPD